MAKVIKKRNWAFVAYPESLPADWLDQLQTTGLPFAVSPLHEYDVNPTGDVKKPHYHVIVCYPGPTTLSVVSSLTESLGQPNPTALESVKGYYRYFTHKDNPEKYQYDETGIRSFGGFDISNYEDLTAREIQEIKNKVLLLIRLNDVVEYSALVDYLLDEGYSQELSIVCNNTIFFDRYVSSRRHRRQQSIKSRNDEFWADVEHTNKTQMDYEELFKEMYNDER